MTVLAIVAPATSEGGFATTAGKARTRRVVYVAGYGAPPGGPRVDHTRTTLQGSHLLEEALMRGPPDDKNPLAWVTASTAAARISDVIFKASGGGRHKVDLIAVSVGGLAGLLSAMAREAHVANKLRSQSEQFVERLRRATLPSELSFEHLVRQIGVPDPDRLIVAGRAIDRLVLLKPALDLARTLQTVVPIDVQRQWAKDGWLTGKAFGCPGLIPHELQTDAQHWQPKDLFIPNPLKTWAIVGTADKRTPHDTAEALIRRENLVKIEGGDHDLDRADDLRAVQSHLAKILSVN